MYNKNPIWLNAGLAEILGVGYRNPVYGKKSIPVHAYSLTVIYSKTNK